VISGGSTDVLPLCNCFPGSSLKAVYFVDFILLAIPNIVAYHFLRHNILHCDDHADEHAESVIHSFKRLAMA
jgi:hypothetical protein